MKHMKTLRVPEEIKKVVDYVTCDICKEKIFVGGYDENSVTILHRSGKHYPESGWGIEMSVDMCGKCFGEKLVPCCAQWC